MSESTGKSKSRKHGKWKKSAGVLAAAGASALVCAASFFIDILTYQPHADSGWSKLLCLLFLPVAIGAVIFVFVKKKKPAVKVIVIACLAVCLWFTYWAIKIPLCPACDRVNPGSIWFLNLFADMNP